jgi:adenylate cyclase
MINMLPVRNDSGLQSTAAAPTPLRIILHGVDGAAEVDVPDGEALVWPLKEAGLPLAAVCGGKGACGTCRVNIPQAWHSRLPEVTRRERRLLDHLKSADGDRLACRITMEPGLAGLPVHPTKA